MTTAAYDSKSWRDVRDSLLYKWVGNHHAVAFLLIIGDTAEVWDDLIDKDKDVTPDTLNHTFVTILTQLPLNPFFDSYKTQLIPLMVTGINTWQDSNLLANGNANDKAMAYVLRDWYIELVMFVVYLLHGFSAMRSMSMEARKFFSQHESLQEFLEN